MKRGRATGQLFMKKTGDNYYLYDYCSYRMRRSDGIRRGTIDGLKKRCCIIFCLLLSGCRFNCAWTFQHAAGPSHRFRRDTPSSVRRISNDRHLLFTTRSMLSREYNPSPPRQTKAPTANSKPQQDGLLPLHITNGPTEQSTVASPSSTNYTPRYYAVQALLPNKQGGAAFAVDRLESSLSDGQTMSSVRDRAFCRLLVTTTERRLGQIDALLEACKNQKRDRTKNRRDHQFVQAVLRVGAAQLLFLDVPPHAAVKETVDVLRLQHNNSFVVSEAQIKYVNAVLRRVAREKELLLESSSITMNAAPWLVQQFRDSWGDVATEQILMAAMSESPRCLTVNHRVVTELIHQQYSDATKPPPTPEQYVADLFPEADILPQRSIRVVQPPPGPISTWPLYRSGAWWCQDPAATIPALALQKALLQQQPKSGDNRNTTTANKRYHVIDLCAAPGGKTAQLCNLLDPNEAVVTAVEISPRRSERLAQNRARLGLDWETVVADACEWLPSSGAAARIVDAVLLDVPCTATGTASKRPDVLRRSATDLTELLDVQQKLAQHAANNILPVGGILVYATCSLLKQESEDQVMKLLQQQQQQQQYNDGTAARVARLETIPFEPGEIPGFDASIDENGWMRVIPGALSGTSLDQCDGFFVARLRRIS